MAAHLALLLVWQTVQGCATPLRLLSPQRIGNFINKYHRREPKPARLDF